MPGPLFVSTTQQVRRAVFAIERKPPTVFQVSGTEAACVLAQFPWGPAQTLTESTSPKDLTNMVAPPGMDRAGQAYAAINKKGFPSLFFVRVMGASPVKAYQDFSDVVPTVIFRATLKYPGTAGNSVVGKVEAATDGDANHFNFTVSVSGTSGSTSETVENINFSGTGDDSTFDFTSSLLLSSITKTNTGVPIAATTTFQHGTSPAVDASSYVGTVGSGDKGLALLEGNGGIRHIFFDDPGNTIRDDCNDGLVAHCLLMGERIGYITGPSGQTLAQARTDVALFRDGFGAIMYIDSWVYQKDDQGNRLLIPGASYAASVASQYPPSTAISWKDPEVQAKLVGIDGLEFDRGSGVGGNTTAGICTITKEETGGYTFEADVTTAAPTDATKANLTRRRITSFIALTAKNNLRSFVDIPNLSPYQQQILNSITEFMDELKNAAKGRDPVHTAHIVDWGMGDLTSENTQTSIQQGKFVVPLDVEDSVGMHQIFISIQSGEGVTISHAA